MAANAFLFTYLLSVTKMNEDLAIYLNEVNLSLAILVKLEDLIPLLLLLLLLKNLEKYLCLSLIFLILPYLFKHSSLL